jgi:hypothetical protein
MKRTADLPVATFTIARVGFVERVVVDDHHRVEGLVVHRDARQVLEQQLARGDAPLFHGGAHLRDARFDDGEAPAVRRGRVRRGRAGFGTVGGWRLACNSHRGGNRRQHQQHHSLHGCTPIEIRVMFNV